MHEKLGEYHSYDNFEWDYECALFKSGSSFGEQAFLAEGNRLVSVKCITDCYLAELHKDKFRKVMKKIELKKEMKLIEFLYEILPFMQFQTINQMRVFANYI